MNESLQFLYNAYFISVLIHIVSLGASFGVVLPLQIKEAKVKNGLYLLRRLMLISGIVIIIINLASVAALTSRFFLGDGVTNRYIVASLIFVHSIGFAIFSVIQSFMYLQQYSPKQKELHEKIAGLE